MMWVQTITQVITALVALAAAVIGPLISIKQIRASTVSSHRQNWINSVRNDVAALVAKLQSLPTPHAATADNLTQALAECQLLSRRAEMSLNPAEDDHIELISLMKRAIKKATGDVIDRVQFTDEADDEPDSLDVLIDKIIKKSQTVFKREWERVKAGE